MSLDVVSNTNSFVLVEGAHNDRRVCFRSTVGSWRLDVDGVPMYGGSTPGRRPGVVSAGLHPDRTATQVIEKGPETALFYFVETLPIFN